MLSATDIWCSYRGHIHHRQNGTAKAMAAKYGRYQSYWETDWESWIGKPRHQEETVRTDGPLVMAAKSFYRQQQWKKMGKRSYPFLKDAVFPERDSPIPQKRRKIAAAKPQKKEEKTKKKTQPNDGQTTMDHRKNISRKRPCAADFFDEPKSPAKVKPEEPPVTKNVWNMVRLCRYEADLNKGDFFDKLAL